MASTRDLIKRLTPDPWRKRVGFSSEIEFVNNTILDNTKSDGEIAAELKDWLAGYQPCLFGRMAAGAADLLSFCIIRPSDVAAGDMHIRKKIQRYRLFWKRKALRGLKSGFVILLTSPEVCNALPDQHLQALALHLCSLYLVEEVKVNQIHLDRLPLRIEPQGHRVAEHYEWRVGANFFAAAGDNRWWHDHRVPGGIAFSMNSVGHMARSGALQKAVGSGDGTPIRGKIGVSTLGEALKFAMMTISGAQDAPSGKATYLRELDEKAYSKLTPRCPFSANGKLKLKDYTTYSGWYHTDVTVPADYFRPDVERPKDVKEKELDFRYLFDDSIDNPDFETTAKGVRIL